jgi:hypothetical protein
MKCGYRRLGTNRKKPRQGGVESEWRRKEERIEETEKGRRDGDRTFFHQQTMNSYVRPVPEWQ